MKYSNYNVFVQLEETKYAIYNLLSEALIELTPEGRSFYLNCLSPENSNHPWLDMLYKNGFIIDDDYDEIDFLRYANKKYCSMTDSLQLTIAPTMDCNCKCVYCFETPHPGKMTSEIMNDVFQFIVKQHQTIRFRFLHIDWFGGEPMICWNEIKQLSERIIHFSNENDITYSAGIISNGTIVSSSIVEEMKKAKINQIQITLDGNRECHDKRRMFRNNSGTFDVILDNLKFFKDSDIQVNIRVNIDRSNRNALENVREKVNAVNPQCHVYPAMVENFTDMDETNLQFKMDNSEFSREIKAPFLLKGETDEELPPRFLSCQAQKLYSFGIDERGYLYKCWNELGMPECAFGTVVDYPNHIVGKNLAKFVGKDYLSNPECLSCKVLPICMGGCAKLRLQNKDLPCIAEKYCIEEYVINKWKNNKS